MKKIKLIFMVLLVVVILTGCQNGKKVKKVQLDLNDGIKATKKILKVGKDKYIRIKLNRLPEGTIIKVIPKYYKIKGKKDNMVYSENILYKFPNDETECILEMLMKETTYKANEKITNGDLNSKNYNKKNTDEEKLDYDYIKIDITKYKE